MKRFFARVVYYFSFFCNYLIKASLIFTLHPVSSEKKLLIVKTDAIGDFILTIPSLTAYRELFPEYAITLLIQDFNLTLAKGLETTYIDEIIIFNKKKYQRNFFYRRSLVKNLKKEGFSLAINPTYSRDLISDCLIQATGASEKIGDRGNTNAISLVLKKITDKWYTRQIDTGNTIPEIERHRKFIESLGGTLLNPVPQLTLSSQEKMAGLKILQDLKLKNREYVVVQIGSRENYKEWPTECFARVIEYIYTTKKLNIILSGTRNENYLSKKIQEKTTVPVVNLIGKTSLLELATILSESKAYIGNDTGTVHLAAAVGTPALCIMGGGHFGRFFPYGDLSKNKMVFDPNMTCKNDNWKCAQNLKAGEPAPCIKNISVDQVIHAVDSILSK